MLRFGGEAASRSLLLDHNLGGLNHGRDGVADLEIHFHGAPPGDHALDKIVPDLDDHMGHHSAKLQFCDLALKTIAR